MWYPVYKRHSLIYDSRKRNDFVKIAISRRQFVFGHSYYKHCNGDKNLVKATKTDCYFNRYGCSLYRNKARLSVSQIFVTVTKSFFLCVCWYLVDILDIRLLDSVKTWLFSGFFSFFYWLLSTDIWQVFRYTNGLFARLPHIKCIGLVPCVQVTSHLKCIT